MKSEKVMVRPSGDRMRKLKPSAARRKVMRLTENIDDNPIELVLALAAWRLDERGEHSGHCP